MSDTFPEQDGIEVSPEQSADAVAAGDAVIVDVREPNEWDAGRIDGATHLPLAELPQRFSELPTDKTIVFQCLSGGRSAMAAEALRGTGADAWSMAGGLRRWSAEGRPLVPEDGSVLEH